MRVVYSDASDTGFGGYTVEHGYHMAQEQWSQNEAACSSTWRELRKGGKNGFRILYRKAYQPTNTLVF